MRFSNSYAACPVCPPGSSVLLHPYKLIEFFEDGHTELYDISKDMGEESDLSASMPDKRNELLKQPNRPDFSHLKDFLVPKAFNNYVCQIWLRIVKNV